MPSKINANFFTVLLILGFSLSTFAVPYVNTPTDRFGKVHDGIYRGAEPKSLKQFKDLKKMGIKTIVNIQSGADKIALGRANAKAAGLNFVSIPLDGFWAPEDWQANMVLAALNNPKLKPLYLHCTHGRERTGLMVALHRVETDGWHADKAYAEAKSYGFRWMAFSLKDYFEERTGTDQ